MMEAEVNPEKPQTKRRGLVSRLFRIAAVLLAVILLLYFAAFVVMGTRWFHDVAERRVVSGIEAATGTHVQLRSLELEPLVFQATIHGLSLRGDEPASSPALLAARTLVIRINPLSFVRRKLLLERFEGEGIAIHLTTSSGGASSASAPSARAAVSRLFALSIRSVVLRDANLFWNDRRIRLDLSARHAELDLHHGMGGKYSGTLSCSSLALARRGRSVPPLAIATKFALARTSLELSDFTWSSAALRGAGSASIIWGSAVRGVTSFQAQGSLAPLARALGWNAIRGGSVSVKGKADYLSGAYGVQGQLKASGVQLREAGFTPSPVDVTTTFNADSHLIKLTDLRVRAFGGSFAGSGEVRLNAIAPAFALRGEGSGIRLADALQASRAGRQFESLLPLAADVSGKLDASWKGALKDFRSSFTLSAAPPARLASVERPLVGRASGEVTFGPRLAIALEQAEFATPHSSLRAQGLLGGTQSNLAIQYATTDFQETQRLVDTIAGLSKPLPLELKSAATFSGVVTGSISDPRIQGRIAAGPFTYHGWAWQHFSGNATASPEGVGIEGGRLSSGSSVVDFSGSAALTGWKLTPRSQLRLAAQATHSPVGGLSDAFGIRVALSGTASGALSMVGTPSSLAGSGKFQIADGSVAGEPFHELSGRVKIAGSAWSFENLVLRKGAGTVAGSARVDLPRRTFSMDFNGNHLSLAGFKSIERALTPARHPPGPSPVEGDLSFSIRGSGSFSDPAVESALQVSDLTLNGNNAGAFRSQLLLKGGEWSGRGQLSGPEGDCDFSAHASARGDWNGEVGVTFTNLHLNPWLRLAAPGVTATPIVAGGSFHLSGPLKRPSALAGRVEAKQLAILIPGFTVKNAGPVELSYSGGSIDSNRFEMKGPSTELQIHLAARVKRPAQVSLEVHGKAQASLLKLLDPSVEAAGLFELNLHASGSPAAPSLAGSIQVRNVSVRYTDLPIPLSELNGTILLQGNRATLESFGEQSGQTSIRLTGYATLRQNPSVNVEAQFHHVRMEYPTGLISILSGNLRLAGSAGSAQLGGEVTVGEMFAGENFNVIDWIGQIGTSLAATPVAAPLGPASKVRLNIRVATDPTVRLDSRTLSYLASIDAKLGGSLARPVMTGDIHIRQGQALVAGTHYQIDRGDITMTSPVETKPVVDIEASTRVARYRLAVEITGPADRPRISYRSDPPLPPEQILSLLALGYAPQQAMMSSTGAQRLGAIGAGSLLTQALSNQVSGRFQRLFGASRIRVDPNLLGPSTAGGARVTIEEQVSKNLAITYSTNTAAAQQRDIRLRWDVSPRISLIGERDINGVYGFEVRFRRSLK